LSAKFEDFYKLYDEYVVVKKPGDIAKSTLKLAEEMGEVSEAVSAILGSKTKIKKIAKDGQTPKDRLIEELADVFVVVNNIAYLADIKVEELLKAGISKMKKRMDDERRGL
jgi:NTP pyrophosphatase (non-canonical NTP hydrolase)